MKVGSVVAILRPDAWADEISLVNCRTRFRMHPVFSHQMPAPSKGKDVFDVLDAACLIMRENILQAFAAFA
jgi:hypothetical protein